MSDLSDLQFHDDDTPEVIPDEMPGQMGLRQPTPQPGTYKFTLPETFNFETFQTEKGQRIRVIFNDSEGGDFRLISPKLGPIRRVQIDNNERVVKGKAVNEFAYLLRALGYSGPIKGNSAYGNELAKHAGESFTADLTWQANCNPKKEVFKEGKTQEGVFGCGQRFDLNAYESKDKNGQKVQVRAIPRDETGKFAERWECSNCGAIIGPPFLKISNFR